MTTSANAVSIPYWPRLMPVALAAKYLSMSHTMFRGLGIVPIEANGRKVLYDRRSLDLYVDRLSGLADNNEDDLDERLRRFGER